MNANPEAAPGGPLLEKDFKKGSQLRCCPKRRALARVPTPSKTPSQLYLLSRTRRQTRARPQSRPRPSPQTRTPSARTCFAGTPSSHCIFPPHSTRPSKLTSRPDPAETRRRHHRKSANGSDLRARPRVAVRGVGSSRSMRRPLSAILCKGGMKPKD